MKRCLMGEMFATAKPNFKNAAGACSLQRIFQIEQNLRQQAFHEF